MAQLVDVVLGVLCGLSSGALMRRVYAGAFKWAFRLPGPVRQVELNVPAGHMASRTAVRSILGTLCGCGATSVLLLLPAFAIRLATTDWRRFMIGWLSGLITAALTVAIAHRRMLPNQPLQPASGAGARGKLRGQ